MVFVAGLANYGEMGERGSAGCTFVCYVDVIGAKEFLRCYVFGCLWGFVGVLVVWFFGCCCCLVFVFVLGICLFVGWLGFLHRFHFNLECLKKRAEVAC